MKKLLMLFVTIGLFLCTTPYQPAHVPDTQVPTDTSATDIPLVRYRQILPRFTARSKETNLKFVQLTMAANPDYVYSRMAAPVTSGRILGVSVAPLHKTPPYLPYPMRQPKKQVVMAREKMPLVVTWHRVPQKQ